MRSVRNYYCRKSLASRLVPHYTALSVITWPCALVSALSDMFSLCIEQCAHTKSQWAHKKLFIFTICVECAVSEKLRVSLQNWRQNLRIFIWNNFKYLNMFQIQHFIVKYKITFSSSYVLDWNSWMVFSFSFRHKDVTRFSVAVVLLKYLHRLVLCCNTEGRGQVECQSFCPPAPFGFVSHFFSFVFVLHVQFCKAKSRCTLSQVVHQQHSVTVSYHSLLQYSPPGLLSSPVSFPLCLLF